MELVPFIVLKERGEADDDRASNGYGSREWYFPIQGNPRASGATKRLHCQWKGLFMPSILGSPLFGSLMEPENWLEIRKPENYLPGHGIDTADLEATMKLSCLQFRRVNAY